MLAIKRTRRLDPDPAFAATFRALAPRLPGSADAALARVRAEGFERFAALGIPTRRDEAWKFTDVARIANRPMRPAAPVELPLERVLPYLLGGPRARRLVFVDGRLQPQWSHTGGLPEGVIVESLARAAETRPVALAEALAGLDDGRSFTALNAAFADSGAWIELPAGVVLDAPLQLLFVATGGEPPVMSHPRCILRLGDGASL
ncbi:MAG: Fe-S cluster assembly protein SufD, partial [Geminicoccaceae bacterium]|nr:Fe-S cluster assembly protein SufD [Geminicoccaceae bacterium]